MDNDFDEEQQAPFGLLTGISFSISTQSDIVSTFLMIIAIFIVYFLMCKEKKKKKEI
jgi:lipoprotein signal peptidase